MVWSYWKEVLEGRTEALNTKITISTKRIFVFGKTFIKTLALDCCWSTQQCLCFWTARLCQISWTDKTEIQAIKVITGRWTKQCSTNIAGRGGPETRTRIPSVCLLRMQQRLLCNRPILNTSLRHLFAGLSGVRPLPHHQKRPGIQLPDSIYCTIRRMQMLPSSVTSRVWSIRHMEQYSFDS